jgi:signal transduction histidine kinase
MSALEVVAQVVEAESYAALSAPAQHAANDFQHLGISQRACAEVPTSSRSRDEFLAMVGHELRNSVSAVRNAVVSARLDSGRCERALDIALR